MTPIFIKKLVIFSVDPEGKWNVSFFSNEFSPTPGKKAYRLKIMVPAELVGETITAEVTDDG
jgi:hypothetical protein